MVLRRPKLESAPVLDGATMVVCTEGFRPEAVARMVERGEWLRIDSPRRASVARALRGAAE
jgi:hypothetical protein